MKPNIIRGKIHHEEPVQIKIRKGISRIMNKVAEAVINGNNVQKMKVSSHPQGSVCVYVFEIALRNEQSFMIGARTFGGGYHAGQQGAAES